MKRVFAVILRLIVLALAYLYIPIKEYLNGRTRAYFSWTNENIVSIAMVLIIGILLALALAKFRLNWVGKLIIGAVVLALIIVLAIFYYPAFIYEYILMLTMATVIGDLIFN